MKINLQLFSSEDWEIIEGYYLGDYEKMGAEEGLYAVLDDIVDEKTSPSQLKTQLSNLGLFNISSFDLDSLNNYSLFNEIIVADASENNPLLIRNPERPPDYIVVIDSKNWVYTILTPSQDGIFYIDLRDNYIISMYIVAKETYKHLLKEGSKIQVDSAIRDGNGAKIDTHYSTKKELNSKQDNLVSGDNIKTINGQSILGSGNLQVGGFKFYSHDLYQSGAADHHVIVLSTDGTPLTQYNFANKKKYILAPYWPGYTENIDTMVIMPFGMQIGDTTITVLGWPGGGYDMMTEAVECTKWTDTVTEVPIGV